MLQVPNAYFLASGQEEASTVGYSRPVRGSSSWLGLVVVEAARA